MKGFTLIELIIVIVILGILSIVAAPRFIDVTSDANVAVLKTMGSAVDSAATLVYAKATIQGLNGSATGNVDLDGDGIADIQTTYGFPSSTRSAGITEAMDDSFETEWTWSTSAGDAGFYLTTASLGGRSGSYVDQAHITPTNCYLIYNRPANTGAKPIIEYITSGC